MTQSAEMGKGTELDHLEELSQGATGDEPFNYTPEETKKLLKKIDLHLLPLLTVLLISRKAVNYPPFASAILQAVAQATKGDTANIAIIARSPKYYASILTQLTPEVVYSLFSHFIAPGGTVTRFEVPGVNAVNSVVTKALGGGGLSSLRLDRQAKPYAQVLLSTARISGVVVGESVL